MPEKLMTLDEIKTELLVNGGAARLALASLVEHVRSIEARLPPVDAPAPVVEPPTCKTCGGSGHRIVPNAAPARSDSWENKLAPYPSCSGKGTISYAGDDDTACPSCPVTVPARAVAGKTDTETAAQLWCLPETRGLQMHVGLAQAIALALASAREEGRREGLEEAMDAAHDAIHDAIAELVECQRVQAEVLGAIRSLIGDKP